MEQLVAQNIQLEKDKYQPNVSAFLALCARNYALILKWLPDELDAQTSWYVEGKFGHLSVTLLENTKYTQLLEISRRLPDSLFVSSPRVIVRVYHDAQLAEVLTSQQIFSFKPVYDYPNAHMHHTDEKFQVNAFLQELLKIGCHSIALT
ncbi:DUF1249 domain-containing protein [Shewanella gaetbuli]|uniref:DUF1249 domain-containing protein n=1 Tax=Shewanella gaetbuli TaxID=220752 RepID=A0A9X2CMV6_9GAMM|nr:DUF1249 domain-containing protein [Shewanella gaetbuli]MCL1144065.1 DUF1249 domain-containing protein [Shewanella gaetbuli]